MVTPLPVVVSTTIVYTPSGTTLPALLRPSHVYVWVPALTTPGVRGPLTVCPLLFSTRYVSRCGPGRCTRNVVVSLVPSSPGLNGFGDTDVIDGVSFDTVNVTVGDDGPLHVAPDTSHSFTTAVWVPRPSGLDGV